MKNVVAIIFLLSLFNILSSQNVDSLVFYYNNAQYFDAIKYGKSLNESKNNNSKYIIGKSYQQLNKFRNAEIYLKEAYFQDTTNVIFINSYAEITSKNNKKSKAIKLYRKALKIDSVNFVSLNNLSNLYIQNKLYKEAISAYKMLSKQDSLNSFYYRRIAFCYKKLKDRKTGLKYYKKAFDTDSTNYTNIKALALFLYHNKKYDDAINICDKGIAINSSYSDFYKIKADSYYKKNHYYLAIPQYKKVIQLKDSSYNVVKRLGMALCDIKKYEEALGYNLAVYNADSSSYSNTSYLSRNYLGLGEYEKCIEFANKTENLLRFAKKVVMNVVDNKASAYTEMNDYNNALKMYDVKYKIFEKRYYFDYYKMALLYDKLDNKKKAIKYYQIVVDKTSDKEDPFCKYSNKRITSLLEDIHFEGNK